MGSTPILSTMKVNVEKLADDIEHFVATTKPRLVRKEELAKKFGVKEHHAAQALAVLNRRGVMHQPAKADWMDKQCVGGWIPDRYYPRTKP